MKTGSLLHYITILAVFAMAARISLDTDTWWHLAAGRWMVENQQILKVDVFSHTRLGSAWEYPGWLIQIPMYLIYDKFGPGGLNIWTALIVTMAFAILWPILRGGPFLRAALILFAATVSAVYWSARPHLITFLLSAVFIVVFEHFRLLPERSRPLLALLLPIMMILWVNSHGGFIIGFLIWGVYWMSACGQVAYGMVVKWRGKNDQSGQGIDVRHPAIFLTLIGAALVIVALINPNGVSIFVYPFKTIGITALQDYIQEWQSPNFHQLHVQPFAWMLLVSLIVLGFSRQRVTFVDLALTTVLAYLGMLAGRNIAIFSLAAPLLLSRHLDPITASLSRKTGVNFNRPANKTRRIINATLFLLILLAVGYKVLMIVPVHVNEDLLRNDLPAAAVQYLKEHPQPGKLFNSYNWGGYLLWSLPEYPVFIDGRTDLYDDEMITQWLQVMGAKEGWENVLSDYGINLILVEKDATLAHVLDFAQTWHLTYQDDHAVIYRRMSER
jgi:hypothetical protein